MRRIFLATALLLGLAAPALADFAEGQGRFAAGDHAGAYEAWLPLAEAGDAKAQYSLGVMHQRGLGRPKDPEGAAAWFGRAARQGYAPATAALKAMDASAPGAGAALSERERVEHALRAMLAQPGGGSYDAIRVAEAGSGFDLAIEGPATSGPGGTFRLSGVTGRANRVAADTLNFEFDVPTAMEGRDAEGRPVTLTVGDARTALVWNETLETATGIDMDWRRVRMEGAEGPRSSFERILVRSDLQRAEGERWGGPTEVRIEGLATAEPGEAALEIGAVTLRADLGGADLARMLRMGRGESEGAGPGLLGELRELLSSASLELAIERLEVRQPEGVFRLADGRWGLALSKLDQAAFDLEIGYRHGGLDAARASPLGGLAPQEAALEITLLRAPMEALLQAGVAAAIEYMLLGELHSAPALLETLRKALPAAGTQLRIDNGLFRAAEAQATATGAFAADAAAPFGVVGAIGVAVSGMDEIVRAAARQDAVTAKIVAALERIGERAADGESLLFRFELGRDGRALVNGRPLAALFAE